MKEVLKLRKRRTGQWVTVAGTVLVGAYMVFGNSVVFADDTQTYPIEVSDSNKFNLTDSPSLLSSENLGTNNREQEVATFATTGLVDSSTETTPEHMMSESSTVSLSTSDVATSETSTSALASLSEVKSQSETMVEHSINSKNEEESGDDLIYNIHNQEVIITAIKRKETVKKIIIPQKISNYRVTEIGSEAFSYSSLNEVVLPSTLRKIGDGAFRGTQLTRLTLPEGVTEIGYEAFSYSSLNEVVLPSTLTKIGSYAFRGTQLKNVTLPTSITDMGIEAFGGIDSLNSVFIPKKLSNAYGAFLGSQHLQRIHFEEGITKIVDGLFRGSGISSIRIPETVTEIGSDAFLNSRITNLYIPDSVTKLGSNSFGHYGVHESAFPTLTKVSLPSQLSSASSPFEGQRNLKEVVFRGDWKIIPNGLFSSTGIKRLVIPEGVTEIGSKAFSYSSLNEVVLPSTLRKIGDEAFVGTKLTRLTLPEGVTEIGSEAFYASSLNEVVLPSTLTKIGDGAFDFTQLKEVVLPSTLTKIGSYAFRGTQLKNVTLPTSITDMGIG
ncbi:leucine-rich repeat domain-containing protein, partial [Streptococcus salivarius]|uniref:leucine-rich repeat domain-containing protein n=1 Tax=Streptococcus salivarius TaxID=1304 RepID=UPI0018ABD9B8